MGKLGFYVYEDDNELVFDWSKLQASNGKVDEALDRLEGGRLSYGGLIDSMDKLIAKNPDLIEAYATKGYALFQCEAYEEAAAAYEAGMKAGLAVIPKDFKGKIIWGSLENRGFLRTVHGYAASLLARGDTVPALKLLERLLVWNPNDNQGVRFIIASEQLRAGTPSKVAAAVKLMDDSVSMHPSFQFDVALHQFRAGEIVKAVTAVRKGIVGAPYLLNGLFNGVESLPTPTTYLEANWLDHARSYLRGGDKAWNAVPGAQQFLIWVSAQPIVKAEIEAGATFNIGLQSLKHDVRDAAFDGDRALKASVSDTSSKQLLKDAGIGPDHDWSAEPEVGFRL